MAGEDPWPAAPRLPVLASVWNLCGAMVGWNDISTLHSNAVIPVYQSDQFNYIILGVFSSCFIYIFEISFGRWLYMLIAQTQTGNKNSIVDLVIKNFYSNVTSTWFLESLYLDRLKRTQRWRKHWWQNTRSRRFKYIMDSILFILSFCCSHFFYW